MSKRYSAKDLDYILKSVLATAYEYMEAIVAEIKKINVDGSMDSLSVESRARLNTLNIHLTMINDIVHAGHKISYKYFKKYAPMLDWYVKNQQIAFENKLVPTCYALCCDPDGVKTAKKAELLNKKLEEYEALNGKDPGSVH